MSEGICPICGKKLSGMHTMGEGWTYYPCQYCKEPELDEKTLSNIRRALGMK